MSWTTAQRSVYLERIESIYVWRNFSKRSIIFWIVKCFGEKLQRWSMVTGEWILIIIFVSLFSKLNRVRKVFTFDRKWIYISFNMRKNYIHVRWNNTFFRKWHFTCSSRRNVGLGQANDKRCWYVNPFTEINNGCCSNQFLILLSLSRSIDTTRYPGNQTSIVYRDKLVRAIAKRE